MSNNWSGYLKVVQPIQPTQVIEDDIDDGDIHNKKNAWYNQLMSGSSSRMNQYRDYDSMDADIEIARSLDVIAEEIAGNSLDEDNLIEISIHDHHKETVSDNIVTTLNEALQHWIEIQELDARIYKIARLMVKYGDVFFLKEPDQIRWKYVHPKYVKGAIVDKDDRTIINGWQLTSQSIGKMKKKLKTAKVKGQDYTEVDFESLSEKDKEEAVLVVPNIDVIRFSLNDDMSDSAPFGESILRSIYKTHKQKELLEDSIIIYRIQRAPERRVFSIAVGNMQGAKVKKYLAGIKAEIRQSRVPTNKGDGAEITTTYNPESQSEDYFFASRGDGNDSSVTTLPGGSGLGEITDLEYFQRKEWRGLRIPSSYMIESTDGGAQYNDGKVGMAYIQELRFATYISHLQSHLNTPLDREFKQYLHDAGINIDPSMFKIKLRPPSNFGTYRQQELDAALLGAIAQADSVDYLAKEFALRKYLQLDDVEIAENAKLLAKQKGINSSDDESNYPAIYGDAEPGEGGDMDAGGDDAEMSAGSDGDIPPATDDGGSPDA